MPWSPNTQMQRLYGRAPCGQRAYGVVPHGHYVAVTMVTAVRLSGPFAAHAFVGAMNTLRFGAWVDGHLAPAPHPGDVVVLDNPPAHQSALARWRIDA